VKKRKADQDKEVTEINAFIVPFTLGEINKNITNRTNTPEKHSKEKIPNQTIQFRLKGNIS
tara:strand:+ start:284 stop:466 length:183 start_codon:yes stop_codon:yes gene_type:complete